MQWQEPTLKTAIRSLCTENHPSEGIELRGKAADMEDLSCLTLGDDVTPSFTWSDVEAELKKLQSEWTAEEYARNRQEDYPNWGDQLNKIYDDGVDKWKTEMVDPVKAKWPKDNSGPK